MGVRRSFDGGYWLTLPNKILEAKFDKEFDRVGTRWYPKLSELASPMSLKGKHPGQEMQIIGKGPSLDNLDLSDLHDSPIICLNQSIKKLDSLNPERTEYILQSDPGIAEESLPVKALLLLNILARGWYMKYANRIIFDPEAIFGTPTGQLSATYAMYFAKLMGCTSVRMICFDACVNGITDYAVIVGPIKRYANERKAGERFLKHRQSIEGTAKKLGLVQTWFLPSPKQSVLAPVLPSKS